MITLLDTRPVRGQPFLYRVSATGYIFGRKWPDMRYLRDRCQTCLGKWPNQREIAGQPLEKHECPARLVTRGYQETVYPVIKSQRIVDVI